MYSYVTAKTSIKKHTRNKKDILKFLFDFFFFFTLQKTEINHKN